MKKILVNLTCINQPPLYSEHNLIPMRFGLDRFYCINVCKSFLIYRTMCNAFKLTMSTCNWKKGTLRHWLRPTERCRTNNVLLSMCCLHTAKSERDHLLACLNQKRIPFDQWHCFQVRTFHARWSYDQYNQVYRWLHGSCGRYICLLYG